MSKLLGVLLILAGVGGATYALSTSSDLGELAFLQVTDIAKPTPAAPINLARAAEPERPGRMHTAAAESQSAPTQPQSTASRPMRPNPAAATPAVEKTQPWPPFVTQVQREREWSPVASHKAPALSTDRVTLARELQRELKRVGCYAGEINGAWTQSMRRAMKAFTDRVNATLPVAEPDDILLALVQSHQDNVCGRPCPAGQGLSEAGRCLPTAILARAATKGSTQVSSATPPRGKMPEPPVSVIVSHSTGSTESAFVPAEPLPEGRMALAGPRTEGPTATPMPQAGVSVMPGAASTREAASNYGPAPPSGYQGPRESPTRSRPKLNVKALFQKLDNLR